MATADSTGLSVDSYDDIVTAYATLLVNAFGSGTKTSADSVFGQILRIFALGTTEQNEVLEYVGDAYNPQAASGTALSNLVLLNGIQRQESAFSTVTLTLTADSNGTTIPQGSLVSEPGTNIQWATDSQLVLAPSASDTVSATCTTAGANAAAANALTQIDTPVFGWSASDNLAAATLGQSEEDDTALRSRRNTVAERASTVSVSAMFQAITDVTGVTEVKVVENATNSTDENGVPPQFVWCIVLGGSDADIAEAIWTHKAAGIGTHGSSSAVYSDPVTGDNYTVYFERPTDVNWYCIVNITADDDYPTDGDSQIEAAVTAYAATLGLGDDVIHSRIYTPVNTVDGHTVDTLYIDLTASPAATDDLAMLVYQRPVLADVTVNS